MKPWRFYGRNDQLDSLQEIIARRRWFFVKVSGRRRIGKTTLIQKALETAGNRSLVLSLQVPDSVPAGVVSAVNDAMDSFDVPVDRFPRPRNLAQLAQSIEAMARAGYILVLDEFQYFNRKGYEEFCSLLQAVVDRLASQAAEVPGGLIEIGRAHV